MTKEKFHKKIGFISLGCDKNRVDLEKMITILSAYEEFEFVGDKNIADVIIVNTCAFLISARDEAQKIILEMAKLKQSSNLQKLVVTGCLGFLEGEKLRERMSDIDAVVLEKDYNKIDDIIFGLYGQEFFRINEDIARKLTTPHHFAYLKIADGCNNRCAYCKIPFIRGNYKSLPMNELVQEASLLCEKGVKEIILVAQDVTRYGCDKNGKENLVKLLKELEKIKKLSWIRLLYCYPDSVSDELIKEIKDSAKVINYIDIPFQHVSDNVLKNMRRRETKKDIITLITKLRNEMDDIKIRSTFMVGFPGETEKDFKELCEFLKEYKLDNVGFFKYSREEGTASFDMKNQISEKIKDKRLKIVQSVQEKIAIENNLSLVGQTFKVLCDSYDSKHNFYVGRSYFCAPDIDFEILFTSKREITIGSFVDVEIVDYDKGYFIGKTEKFATY
ncbi:MAG: 30S ribosomal protein S12 methylthiotransferase RimO [Clostridia bacterium]|nr:30S ribosomal protein S12 methylthiotransferase RimO [Clostridia bacterium]